MRFATKSLCCITVVTIGLTLFYGGCDRPTIPRDELGEVVTDLSDIPGMDISYQLPPIPDPPTDSTDSEDQSSTGSPSEILFELPEVERPQGPPAEPSTSL